MKTQFKLVTAAVATAVGLAFSVPLFAADMSSGAMDSKADRKRCQEMPKGAERDSCMKDVRASERAAKSERRAARGTQEKSDNPEAGVVTGTDKAMGKDGRGPMGKAKGASDPAMNPSAVTNARSGSNPEASGKQDASRKGERATGSTSAASGTPSPGTSENKSPEATGRQK